MCCTVTLMSNRRLVYYDLQAESSGWLFKSPLAGFGAFCVCPTTGRTACFRCCDFCWFSCRNGLNCSRNLIVFSVFGITVICSINFIEIDTKLAGTGRNLSHTLAFFLVYRWFWWFVQARGWNTVCATFSCFYECPWSACQTRRVCFDLNPARPTFTC